MTKKTYQQPAMNVVKMLQQKPLMGGSTEIQSTGLGETPLHSGSGEYKDAWVGAR